MIKGADFEEFRVALRNAPFPEDQKRRYEWQTLMLWAESPSFVYLMPDDGPFEIDWGSDPPDLEVRVGRYLVAVELTRITTPRYEVFDRNRPGAQSLSSVLRLGAADKGWWDRLRSHKLPEDRRAEPHGEYQVNLDKDYRAQAAEVVRGKREDLAKYRHRYGKTILVVRDRLSWGNDDWERHQWAFARINAPDVRIPSFDHVVLVGEDVRASENGFVVL